jgi:signal transduction histidine kinase
LGLAISKGIVEAHGGRIWAAPREGGGTMVIFALPLEVPK